MSMIERVARVIHQRCGWATPDFPMEDYLEDARAVLEEMRKPTPEMLAAANRNNHPRDADTWETMIDAALSPSNDDGTQPARSQVVA